MALPVFEWCKYLVLCLSLLLHGVSGVEDDGVGDDGYGDGRVPVDRDREENVAERGRRGFQLLGPNGGTCVHVPSTGQT